MNKIFTIFSLIFCNMNGMEESSNTALQQQFASTFAHELSQFLPNAHIYNIKLKTLQTLTTPAQNLFITDDLANKLSVSYSRVFPAYNRTYRTFSQKEIQQILKDWNR